MRRAVLSSGEGSLLRNQSTVRRVLNCVTSPLGLGSNVCGLPVRCGAVRVRIVVRSSTKRTELDEWMAEIPPPPPRRMGLVVVVLARGGNDAFERGTGS